jgi:hypothetical protein
MVPRCRSRSGPIYEDSPAPTTELATGARLCGGEEVSPCQPDRSDGHHGDNHGATLTLAERLRRARDRVDSSRVSGSHRDLQRASSAPGPVLVCRLLPTLSHSSFATEGLPRLPPHSASQHRKSRRHPKSRRLASSLRPSRRLIPLGLLLTNRRAGAVHRRLRIYASVGSFDLDQKSALVVRIAGFI